MICWTRRGPAPAMNDLRMRWFVPNVGWLAATHGLPVVRLVLTVSLFSVAGCVVVPIEWDKRHQYDLHRKNLWHAMYSIYVYVCIHGSCKNVVAWKYIQQIFTISVTPMTWPLLVKSDIVFTRAYLCWLFFDRLDSVDNHQKPMSINKWLIWPWS